MTRSLRTLRLDAVLIQAVIAGALSFAHLHDIAAAAGQTGWKAWAYPVSVDLLLVAAWRRIRTARQHDTSARAAWVWFAVALTASLGANVATAGLMDLQQAPEWLRIVVAGWPAVAFFGGTLLAHQPAPAGEAAAPVDRAPAPKRTSAVAVDRDHPAASDTKPSVPAIEAARAAGKRRPEPSSAGEPAPDPSVPPALIEHARKIAFDHVTRTGREIDTETLRARLGVPPALATVIATHLT